MSGSHQRPRLQREKDLAEVARRYLKGESQSEIAEILHVNQSTVSRDIRFLQKRWIAAANVDFDAARAEQLAKIDELERTYWEAWKHSLSREITVSEKKEGSGAQTKALLRRETRDGNPAFLEGIRWCIDRRCKLLGLDAPIRLGVGGMDGGPIRHEFTHESDVDQELARMLAGVGSAPQGEDPLGGYQYPPGFQSAN